MTRAQTLIGTILILVVTSGCPRLPRVDEWTLSGESEARAALLTNEDPFVNYEVTIRSAPTTPRPSYSFLIWLGVEAELDGMLPAPSLRSTLRYGTSEIFEEDSYDFYLFQEQGTVFDWNPPADCSDPMACESSLFVIFQKVGTETTSDISLTWKLHAWMSGPGQKDMPDGAFVEIVVGPEF